MKALIMAIACLMTAPAVPSGAQSTERDFLSLLLERKARWNEATKTLTLSGAGKFNRQDLRSVRELPDVRGLHIAYTLENDDLACLREVGPLETLVLKGDHFTDKGILHIASLSSLKTLVLVNCRLGVSGVEALSGSHSLTTLSLRGVTLSKDAIAALPSVPSLRVLTLYNGSSLDGLAGCHQLRVLELNGVDTTVHSEEALLEELAPLNQLDRLFLSIREKNILPSSAESWFAVDIKSKSFVATSHYPLRAQLMKAMPNTNVSIEFANRSVFIQSATGRANLKLK